MEINTFSGYKLLKIVICPGTSAFAAGMPSVHETYLDAGSGYIHE